MRLIPKLTSKSILLPHFTVFVLLTYVLFYSNFINIANYSFLRYTYSGVATSNPFLSAVIYSRLPMLIFGFLGVVIVLSKDINLRIFLLKNVDVLLFISVMYLGLINSIDVINGTIYTIWHSLAFLSLLVFYYYLRVLYCLNESLRVFFQFLFWSNFIVLPLLILNIYTLGGQWHFEMAFSSKTFYPYCLLSMMLALYGSKVFTKKSIFSNKKLANNIIELLVVVLLFFFAFLSARRTPLFLMILISFPYLFSSIGKRIWKRFVLLFVILVVLIYSLPKAYSYIEEHKYELSILKKLNDLQESKGNLGNDSSYAERLQVWELYGKIVKTHPIVGVGSYNSKVHLSNRFHLGRLSELSTHNTYLGILVEHGYLGFVLFLVIIMKSIIILIKKSFALFIMYGIYLLLPVMIINWAEYNLLPGQVFYWSTVLIILFPRIFLK